MTGFWDRVFTPLSVITLIAKNSFLGKSSGISVDGYYFTISDNIVVDGYIRISLDSGNNILLNNKLLKNSIGLGDGHGNKIIGNNISSTEGECGIYFGHSEDKDDPSGGGLIYNNFFNNTVNFINRTETGNSRYVVDGAVWNTTKTPGTSIIGGPFLDGNFWEKPDETGYEMRSYGTGILTMTENLTPQAKIRLICIRIQKPILLI